MEARRLALRCRELADDKKAENLIVLDVRKLSSVTDYYVLATGTSEPHLRAIVDEITERLAGEHSLRARATDGSLRTNWVVLDYFDVIVHVMRADVRAHYDLEGLWGDAPRVRLRAYRQRRLPSRSGRSVRAGAAAGAVE
ncbi:MAG: ribosome silencing factor [Verrucomicrobia bacterium]|nr:ribosome silencing factor [Verrucomicrobiota bacterium]